MDNDNDNDTRSDRAVMLWYGLMAAICLVAVLKGMSCHT